MNAAMFSKKPNTLTVSPAFAVASWPCFRRDLARTIPARAKGIAKDVKNRFPIPNQNEIEKITLISPNARLKVPLFSEMLLILFPPVRKSYTIHLANPELREQTQNSEGKKSGLRFILRFLPRFYLPQVSIHTASVPVNRSGISLSLHQIFCRDRYT